MFTMQKYYCQIQILFLHSFETLFYCVGFLKSINSMHTLHTSESCVLYSILLKVQELILFTKTNFLLTSSKV